MTPLHLHAEQFPMFVIDVLRYDIEQVPSIVNLLNDRTNIGWREYWPHDFTEAEVIGALGVLTAERLVDVYQAVDDASDLIPCDVLPDFTQSLDNYWFLLLDSGRQKLEQWQPPNPPENRHSPE